MRYLAILLIILHSCFATSQEFNGIWRGVMIQNGLKIDQATLLYLTINENGGSIDGISRNEMNTTDYYCYKKYTGSRSEQKFTLKEIAIAKKSIGKNTKWCRMNFDLYYDSLTGYIKGNFSSYDCRNVQGTVILYRTADQLDLESVTNMPQHWFEIFRSDLSKGLSSPERRIVERNNFVFEPVYFDYDKDEIKPEYWDFLNRMIKVVEGHSDLRVKVTGHTDSDGSDGYNDDLSKRRAEAIISYFVMKGLKRDRLIFDFKGEKQPVDTNTTKEGKQHNRRVDFEFI